MISHENACMRGCGAHSIHSISQHWHVIQYDHIYAMVTASLIEHSLHSSFDSSFHFSFEQFKRGGKR